MTNKFLLSNWLKSICNVSFLLQHVWTVITNARVAWSTANSSPVKRTRTIKFLCLNCFIDVTIGIAFYQLITRTLVHDVDTVALEIITMATFVKERLVLLIDWLMGVPAGLKLNNELSSFLGTFFLFHVEVWMAYLTVIQHYLPQVLNVLLMFNYLGFSMFLTSLNDFVNALSFHLHCFYVYAASLYRVQLQTLLALARLFRGT